VYSSILLYVSSVHQHGSLLVSMRNGISVSFSVCQLTWSHLLIPLSLPLSFRISSMFRCVIWGLLETSTVPSSRRYTPFFILYYYHQPQKKETFLELMHMLANKLFWSLYNGPLLTRACSNPWQKLDLSSMSCVFPIHTLFST